MYSIDESMHTAKLGMIFYYLSNYGRYIPSHPGSQHTYKFTSPAELAHIEGWAAANNLQLNSAKTKEIVFRSHRKRGKDAQLPAPHHDIERVTRSYSIGRRYQR